MNVPTITIVSKKIVACLIKEEKLFEYTQGFPLYPENSRSIWLMEAASGSLFSGDFPLFHFMLLESLLWFD